MGVSLVDILSKYKRSIETQFGYFHVMDFLSIGASAKRQINPFDHMDYSTD